MEDLEYLRQQNAALTAQVEALQSTAAKVVTGDAEIAELEPLLDATPQQHLAEIRAEAGRAGFIAGTDALEVAQILGSDFDTESAANQYAEQIRQGEVK